MTLLTHCPARPSLAPCFARINALKGITSDGHHAANTLGFALNEALCGIPAHGACEPPLSHG
eukprot:15465254-Alexandrium_andersonii.AAC.2